MRSNKFLIPIKINYFKTATQQDGFYKIPMVKPLEELPLSITKNIKIKEPNTRSAVLDFLIVSMSNKLRICFLTLQNYGYNKMAWKLWTGLSILEIETSGGA